MRYIKGDLLNGKWDVACHVANSYVVMSSGIAYFLKKKWPSVYQADIDYDNSFPDKKDSKLGTFSKAEIEPHRFVYNIYSMFGIGNDGSPLNRNLSYDHFYNGLYKVCSDILKTYILVDGPIVVGMPMNIGCCRAGGNWEIVDTILFEIEKHFQRKIEFEVYQLENAETTAQSSVFIEPNYITPM